MLSDKKNPVPPELTHPLRSSPITGPSTLLQDDPPPCFASVLSFLWGLHLNFSLDIETIRLRRIPHKSLDQVHAISMPDAAQTINRHPLGLSYRPPSIRSFDAISDISTPHQWFACAHLLDPYLARSCHAFPLTLTTTALYRCSLRWFEACSCKPAPRGLPSSSLQLTTLCINSALVAHLEKSKVLCNLNSQNREKDLSLRFFKKKYVYTGTNPWCKNIDIIECRLDIATLTWVGVYPRRKSCPIFI
jgi:hypothetical protein